MISITVPEIIWIVIFLIIFGCVYFYYNSIKTGPVIDTRSGVDFNLYTVRDSPDHQGNTEAANRLAMINKEITRLVNYMKKNSIPNKETADLLFTRWSGCELKETALDETHIAFTIDKGKSINMCVRDSEQNLQDYNVGMFVVLHELAHIMSKSKNHTDEFKDNFIKIIETATKIGVYKPVDFIKEPKNYCGTVINTF
jgi:hypothetical protein